MKVSREWLDKNGFTIKSQYQQYIKTIEYYDIYDEYTQFTNGIIYIREIRNTRDSDARRWTTTYWLSIDGIDYNEIINKTGDIKTIVKKLCNEENESIYAVEQSLNRRRTHLNEVKMKYKIN